MKCGGCVNQTYGFDIFGNKVLYCIGSPETGAKYGAETKLDVNRIIFTKDTPIYRANSEDECHCWFSDRFEKPKD